MNNTTKISAIVAALAGVLFAAPVVQAQTARAVRIAGPVATRSAALREAESLFEQPARWSEAARLMVAAAKQRAPGDPEKAGMLATAARLYAYTGNTHRALYWMQQAGQQALEGGDVIAAAQTFTQAAHLAAAQQEWTKVKELAQKVSALSSSPLLDEAQRTAIRAPFEAQTVAAR